MITKEVWERNRPPTNPFLKYEFLKALTESGSIGPGSGWMDECLSTSDGVLLGFQKNHSYGEYIFDWAWAEAYERYGIPYYPKLTSMIPFTPVTTQHFLMKEFSADKALRLLAEHERGHLEGPSSSTHFLFLHPQELPVFRERNFLIRESMQYHFFNEGYQSFEDFLSKLKTKKAKNILKERRFPDLEIKRYTGDDLTKLRAQAMYQFYISTIENKNSFDYLKPSFFELIFETLRSNTLYVEATFQGAPIAGALFFYDHERLYGRYWGSTKYREHLHFELCYYQGIDFCLEKKLKVFEAGAQGEHKITRGFRPVRTYSAHKLKIPAFEEAVANFITTEKKKIEEHIEVLSTFLPFKS